MNILKTGLFFIFVPLLLAVGLPLWFIRTTSPLFSFGIFRWLAILFWAVGWAFVLLSFWNFATRGQGTPNPLDPPRRLVVTWAFPEDEARKGAHSRVTYAIDPHVKGVVRLTVTHEGLKAGSDMERGITSGWPIVLSGLKTLLERGRSLGRLW